MPIRVLSNFHDNRDLHRFITSQAVIWRNRFAAGKCVRQTAHLTDLNDQLDAMDYVYANTQVGIFTNRVLYRYPDGRKNVIAEYRIYNRDKINSVLYMLVSTAAAWFVENNKYEYIIYLYDFCIKFILLNSHVFLERIRYPKTFIDTIHGKVDEAMSRINRSGSHKYSMFPTYKRCFTHPTCGFKSNTYTCYSVISEGVMCKYHSQIIDTHYLPTSVDNIIVEYSAYDTIVSVKK